MAIARARGLTPLVGRDAELAQLAACFARAGERLPQVVSVVGEAGSGKSRLVYELRQKLAGEPRLFFEARCSSLSQAIPYAPMAGMLRQFFGIDTGEPAESARAKIAARIGDVEASSPNGYPTSARLLGVGGEAVSDDHHPRGGDEARARSKPCAVSPAPPPSGSPRC